MPRTVAAMPTIAAVAAALAPGSPA